VSRGGCCVDLLGDRPEGLGSLWPDDRLVTVEQHIAGCHKRRLTIPREHLDVRAEILRLQSTGIDVDVGEGRRLDTHRLDLEFG